MGTTTTGKKVFFVDGDHVRNGEQPEMSDFVEGGHHLRYSWIPADEIWLEEMPHADDTEANPKTGKRIGPFAKSHSNPKYRVWEAPENSAPEVYGQTQNYVKRITDDVNSRGRK